MFCLKCGTKGKIIIAVVSVALLVGGWFGWSVLASSRRGRLRRIRRDKQEARNQVSEEDLRKNYEQARHLCESGELERHPEKIAEVVELAKPAAENGNADAQFLLGACYEFMRRPFTERVPPDRRDQTFRDAEGNIFGYEYQWAAGIKWYDRPARWYFKSAKLGNREAQRRIAEYYRTGLGVLEDPAEADKWERQGGNNVDETASKVVSAGENDTVGLTIDEKKLVAWSAGVWRDHAEPEPPPEDMDTPDVQIVTPVVSQVESADVAPPTNEPASVNSAILNKSPVKLPGVKGVARDAGSIGQKTKGGAMYGDPTTERAVLMALRWLKATQEPDGSWGTKPELGLTKDMDKAAGAGFAVLTFLAHGETPDSPEFGTTVERALNYLIDSVYVVKDKDGNEVKDPNGNAPYVKMEGAGGNEYGFLIGTYALCEAYAMTKNPNAKAAAEKNLRRIIDGQTATGGWNPNLVRETNDGSDDLSFGVWAMLALKAAKMGGIHLEGMDECIQKAITCLKTRNYNKTAGFVCRPGGQGGGLAGTGCLCLQLFGCAKDPEVANALKVMKDWQPTLDETHMSGDDNAQYCSYFAAQCKYQAGMAERATPANLTRWKKWNTEMKALYPKSIVKVLKKDGTPYTVKDAKGKDREIGHWVNGDKYNSDVMGTCLAALQLMVYYRYLPTTSTQATKVEADVETQKVKKDNVGVSIDI